MTKTVLDIGNCDPDHASIKSMLSTKFEAQVLRAHQLNDAISLLESSTIDLIVVNRKLDIDYSDGIEIIKRLKQDPKWKHIPVMLVTNYEEHQLAAIAEGAVYGFGKLELRAPQTHERLAAILSV